MSETVDNSDIERGVLTDEQKLAYLREQIAEGDRDIAEGRVLPPEEVFATLRQKLANEFPTHDTRRASSEPVW
jgi:predicted transcriptional regulator